MEINAARMKTFIPAECFIPTKHYLYAWVCVDVFFLGRQETKLALGKISLFAWYQKYCNFLKWYVFSTLIAKLFYGGGHFHFHANNQQNISFDPLPWEDVLGTTIPIPVTAAASPRGEQQPKATGCLSTAFSMHYMQWRPCQQSHMSHILSCLLSFWLSRVWPLCLFPVSMLS